MKTLTATACAEWLATRAIPQAPRSQSPDVARHHECGRLTGEALRQASIGRQILAACEPFGVALLQFTDWPLYKPDEMAILASLRAGAGDGRPLIESPGHVFDVGERALLIGMFILAMHYGYSAYVYFDHGATAFCWKGEMLDFWCPDESLAATVRDVLRTHAEGGASN